MYKVIIGGIVLGAVGVFVWVHNQQSFDRQFDFFDAKLNSQIVAPIRVDGVSEGVKDANISSKSAQKEIIQALRLGHYATEQRIAPLYSLPGTDIESFKKSIEALQDSEKLIAEQYSADEAVMIHENLYPIDFLKNLGDLEEIRRKLISNPSDDLVYSYNSKLIFTIEAYKNHITNFLETLSKVDTTRFNDTTVRYHGGYSDIEYMKRVYEEYLSVADKQEERALNRLACFDGKIEECESLKLPELPIRDFGDITVFGQIPSAVATRTDIVKRMRKEPYVAITYNKDVAVLADSQCFLPYRPAYYYMWGREGVNGVTVFHPEIVNEIMMYDLAKGKQAIWKYSKRFISEGGGPYLFQPVATHYVCPDLVSDLGRLKSMLFVHDKTTEVLYDGDDEVFGGYITRINELRRDLLNSLVLSEYDVYLYVAAVNNLFKKYDSSYIATEISIPTALALESLIVTYVYGTYDYEEIIMSVVGNNHAVPEYAALGTNTSLEELFYIRSAPKALLGGFNPSIVPNDISFVEVPAQTLPDTSVHYSDVEDQYTPDEWVSLLQNSVRVEIELAKEIGIFIPTNQ